VKYFKANRLLMADDWAPGSRSFEKSRLAQGDRFLGSIQIVGPVARCSSAG
jgi:hypothetical protein